MKLHGNSKKNTNGQTAAPEKAAPPKRPDAPQKSANSAKDAKPNQPPVQKKPPKNNQGGTKNRMPIIIGAIFVALFAVVFTGFGVWVGGVDTIFPNISISGISIGGKELSEAETLLTASGFGNETQNSVTVNIPVGSSEGESLVISAIDAGMALSPSSAARLAFDYGRSSGFFANTFKYLGCLMGTKELDLKEGLSIKEDYIKSEISLFTKDISAMLVETETTVTEDSIKLIKGGNAVHVNEEDLYALIEEAFLTGNYTEITYTPEVTEAATIDLQKLYDSVYKDSVDSQYDKTSNGVTDHVNGISFDMSEAKNLWDEASNGQEVVIPLVVKEPDVTSTHLQSVLFADILGQKSTSLSGSSASRINNITLAANAINGLVLNPGEEFSFNDVVGERTTAKGYKAAGAYSGGEVVQEVGGGICQVSSTIYYSAVLANLQITNRLCHQMIVTYLPVGLDATVSWGGPEFKFKNDRDFPIKIETYTDTATNTIMVKIHGTDVDGSYVSFTGDSWPTANGHGAISYRWIYSKDGTLIEKREEATSQYRNQVSASPSPSPTPSTAPTPTPSTSPSGEPNPTPPVTDVPPPTDTSAPTPPPASPDPVEPTTPVTPPDPPPPVVGDTEAA